MTTNVVAHQIARTSQQLDERISERSGVQTPQNSNIFLDGVPPHAPHFGTLATARTEVVSKLISAVITMPDGVLMTIDIMRPSLLPEAETVVFLFYLLFVQNAKVQKIWK